MEIAGLSLGEIVEITRLQFWGLVLWGAVGWAFVLNWIVDRIRKKLK